MVNAKEEPDRIETEDLTMRIIRVARLPNGVIIDKGGNKYEAFSFTTADVSCSISNKAVHCICLTIVALTYIVVAATTGIDLITPAFASVIELWKLKGSLPN
jgi:hypothetical protein